MTKPVLLIFSRRTPLLDAAARLAGSFDLILCDDADEAVGLCRVRRPAGVLLDFAETRREAEAESRLLDVVAGHPDVTVHVIAPDLCPRPLAQGLKRTAITPVSPRLAPEAVVAAVERAMLPDPPAEETGAGEPEPVDRPAAATEPARPSPVRGGASLEGITRRFETTSAPLVTMLGDLEIAARHDVTILLIGETGAGKTFLSRLIHEVSPRRAEPFLTVACGALPSDLIESELFGHVKGSFTGAHADKDGKFLAAGKGTILLDEIDVLGPEQQVKLLRVIETGEFEPVGSNVTHRSRARLVVASNLNLQPLVEEGRFRPDLYYRLNMLKFDLPPLRSRKGDIEPLARGFVARLAEKHGIEIARIDRGFLEALHLYPWPGNVRELENVVQRAVIFCRDGVLTAAHLPPHIIAGQAGPTNDPSVRLGGSAPVLIPASLNARVSVSEKEIIEQTLYRNNYSRMNTARDLGISRVTLYNKMKKYGMMR